MKEKRNERDINQCLENLDKPNVKVVLNQVIRKLKHFDNNEPNGLT